MCKICAEFQKFHYLVGDTKKAQTIDLTTI